MSAVRLLTSVAGIDTGNGDRQYSGEEGDELWLSDKVEDELVTLGWAVSIGRAAQSKPKPIGKPKKED